jgi:hypothetical protein
MSVAKGPLTNPVLLGFLGAALFIAACEPHNWTFVQMLPDPTAPPQGGSLAMTDDVALIGFDGTTNIVDVFSNNGTGWVPAQQLSPQTGAVGAFGSAVAIDHFSDQTLAVGAPRDVYEGTNTGYVDVYTRPDTFSPWTIHQPGIRPSNWPTSCVYLDEFDFGNSVSIYDDLLVIGASRFCDGMGLVFVFQRGTDGMYQQVAVLMENATIQHGDANFGDSVAVVNGTIAISRPNIGSGSTATNPGRVYIYSLSSAIQQNPLQVLTSRLTAANTFDGFGTAIALGFDQLAVRSNTSVEYFTGATTFAEVANTAVSPAPEAVGSIALNASTLVIGEPLRDPAGEIDVFDLTQGTIGGELVLTEPSPTAGDQFGAMVAIDFRWLLAEAKATSTTLAFERTFF